MTLEEENARLKAEVEALRKEREVTLTQSRQHFDDYLAEKSRADKAEAELAEAKKVNANLLAWGKRKAENVCDCEHGRASHPKSSNWGKCRKCSCTRFRSGWSEFVEGVNHEQQRLIGRSDELEKEVERLKAEAEEWRRLKIAQEDRQEVVELEYQAKVRALEDALKRLSEMTLCNHGNNFRKCPPSCPTFIITSVTKKPYDP